MSDAQIINDDVLTFPLGTFDGFATMIVDPPYSDHVHKNMVSANEGGRGYVERDPGFESLTPALRGLIAGIARRMQRWSAIFADIEGVHGWKWALRDGGARYIRAEIWTRWSQPQKSGDRPGAFNEAIAIAHAVDTGRMRWNGPGSRMSYTRRALRGEDKHPTEKPLDLMLDLVSAYSDPGEAVIDPCAGSGTTALACALLGRDCVAVERDPKWVAVGEKRLAALPTAARFVNTRDRERAEEWCVTTSEEAERVPTPKAPDGSDVKTWERAQRRLADVARVAEWL